jgi:CubicO group peptidase (beta-lactamase class C family)
MNNPSISKRLLCIVGFSLVLPWLSFAADMPSASPASKGLVAERLSRIRPVIQTEIDAKRMPGAVLLIARKGAVVHTEVVGLQDPASGKPLKRDSLFRAYSMTKPLVSVLAMMMVEEGQLQLGDPVAKFLPALANMQVMANPADASGTTVNAVRQITVYDLLRHTSGLTYAEFTRSPSMKSAYQQAGLFSPDMPSLWITLTPEQQVEAFAKAPLQWQPGSTWEYSLSTDLLGRVLEVVGKKPLGSLLEEKLIKPLGMKDTHFVVPSIKADRLAQALAIDPLTKAPMPAVLLNKASCRMISSRSRSTSLSCSLWCCMALARSVDTARSCASVIFLRSAISKKMRRKAMLLKVMAVN